MSCIIYLRGGPFERLPSKSFWPLDGLTVVLGAPRGAGDVGYVQPQAQRQRLLQVGQGLFAQHADAANLGAERHTEAAH